MSNPWSDIEQCDIDAVLAEVEEIDIPEGWHLVDHIPESGPYKTYSHTHGCFVAGTCMTEPMYIIAPNAKPNSRSGG